MPLQMVHLTVAHKILELQPNIDNTPLFLLGSIGPDAVHMREGSDRTAKNITHLRKEDNGDWENAAKEYIVLHSKDKNAAFFAGYGVHVLTDILWNTSAYRDFEKQYAADRNPMQDSRSAYYNDTDLLDLELYNTMPWRSDVWEMLANTASPEGDLLSAEETEKWKIRTLEWFDAGKSLPDHPLRYMAFGDVTAFCDYAAAKISGILSEINTK